MDFVYRLFAFSQAHHNSYLVSWLALPLKMCITQQNQRILKKSHETDFVYRFHSRIISLIIHHN